MLYSEESAHRRSFADLYGFFVGPWWGIGVTYTGSPVQVGADPVLTTTLMTHLNAYADTRKHFVMVSSKKHVCGYSRIESHLYSLYDTQSG
jgi:hypothetical protein